MTGRLRVAHLVDDTTAGGVMRVLDHLLTTPALAQDVTQSRVVIERKAILARRLSADVIVSHLAIRWRALPFLIDLRLRHPRCRLVHVEHSYTEGFVAANVTHKRRFGALLRLAYRLFDEVVAVSAAQADWLARSGVVRENALRAIPSCVDLGPFRKVSPRSGPVRVIAAIGRLDRQKGFDTLIRAFRQIARPDIRLHIHGEGAEEAALRALAEGDPRIRFLGFTPDPTAALAAVDAVAMPSLWEAYGLVAIEALAAGRQLLVTPLDGLTDHIPLGAIPTRDGSVAAWTEALKTLISTPDGGAPGQTDTTDGLERRFATRWRAALLDWKSTPGTPRHA